jgi:hypothetical protein
MPDKPRFEISADTIKCADYLRPRARATYYELSKHLSRNIKGRDRYVLTGARRKLEQENIVFVVETGIGVVRAEEAQVASLSTQEPINRIRRSVRRAGKRQKIVNIQNLTADERAAFYIGRAVLGAISQAVRESFQNKVSGAVAVTEGPLALDQTIELFSKLRSKRNNAGN